MQKTNQKEFRIEKLIKRKGDQLYVKWKGYNNSFNSWINNLVNKTDYNTKISEIENKINDQDRAKYITT